LHPHNGGSLGFVLPTLYATGLPQAGQVQPAPAQQFAVGRQRSLARPSLQQHEPVRVLDVLEHVESKAAGLLPDERAQLSVGGHHLVTLAG